MQRRRLPNARPQAPTYEVALREVIAVEHPAIIKNLDNALKSFGRNNPFERILNSVDPEECVPLYLRFDDPACAPILSHNSATNNVLLKVTVPKRTGRKRKRGSQDPYTDDGGPVAASEGDNVPAESNLCSQARMDYPTSLMRKLKDNVGKYTIEAVAEVGQTHRYRGLADFHQSTSHSNFFSRFRDAAFPGDIDKMREFKFDLSRGWKPNEEILPPPFFTPHPLPFNWGFLQNPSIVEEVDPSTGKTFLKNNQKLWRPKMDYIPYYMETVPQEPGVMPEDPELLQFINELAVVYNERPAWTRRAIGNHFKHSPRIRLLKQALPFIGYGFKGGPFRDAIIKYGLDPRKDKKYRIYQTTYFQIVEKELRAIGTPWRDARFTNKKDVTDDTGHIFDGKSLAVDGKIWQMCDVTDPLLAKLIREAPFRQEFEIENDGWFLNGTVAKIKAIMKTKLVALRTGKQLKDSDFEPALETADDIPDRLSRSITVPVPNMTLSVASIQKLRESGKEIELVSSRYNVKRGRQYNGPLRLKKPLDGKTRPAAKQRPSNGQAPGTKRNPKSKSKTPDGEAGAVSREQSVANSIDPRLLADQEDEGAPDSGIGDDGGAAGETGEFGGYIDQLEGYGGYDDGIDDETEHSEEDSDRASDSEDSGSEMEEDEDDEDRESDDSDSADSIDFVQYFDPQLAQDQEARPS